MYTILFDIPPSNQNSGSAPAQPPKYQDPGNPMLVALSLRRRSSRVPLTSSFMTACELFSLSQQVTVVAQRATKVSSAPSTRCTRVPPAVRRAVDAAYLRIHQQVALIVITRVTENCVSNKFNRVFFKIYEYVR